MTTQANCVSSAAKAGKLQRVGEHQEPFTKIGSELADILNRRQERDIIEDLSQQEKVRHLERVRIARFRAALWSAFLRAEASKR